MMVGEEESLTMWSESLMESLYVALRKQKPDKILKQIIEELKAKGYEDKYLLNRAREKVGPRAETRVAELLGHGGQQEEKQKEQPLKVDPGAGRGVSRPARKVRARQVRWSERARRSSLRGRKDGLGFFDWLRSLFSR